MEQLQQTGFSLWVFLHQVTFKWDVLMVPTDLNHMGIKKVFKKWTEAPANQRYKTYEAPLSYNNLVAAWAAG